MAYQATLNGTQQLTVINQGIQTQITLMTSSSGQQQSQSSSFLTGVWTKPPQLFQSAEGFFLHIEGAENQYLILIQSNSLQIIDHAISLDSASKIELTPIANPASQSNFEPISPMPPMQPMKMGNMSMDINSMSMQMGNMSLNLNNQSKTTGVKTFCPKCGSQAKPGDLFCRSCGHNLSK